MASPVATFEPDSTIDRTCPDNKTDETTRMVFAMVFRWRSLVANRASVFRA